MNHDDLIARLRHWEPIATPGEAADAIAAQAARVAELEAALRELVACAEVSVPYIALKTEGYRWHEAVTSARAVLLAARGAK